MYFGVILIIEKTFLLNLMEKIPSVFRHIYSIILILIGWVIFEFESVSKMGDYILSMFGIKGAGFVNSEAMFMIREYGIIFIVLILASTPIPKLIVNKLGEKIRNMNIQWISYVAENAFNISVLFISTAYLVDASYNPFLYFRF